MCGEKRAKQLWQVREYRVVRCRGCGLVFVGNPPEEAQLAGFYQEDYWEAPDHPGYGGYGKAESRKRHHFRGLLATLERVAPRVGDLLEVGCAYGYFLAEARDRGWRASGLEPSAHAARQARDRLGLSVHNASIEDLPSAPDSVDAVVLWDVIEHLPRPLRTLRAAAARLRPGGVLGLSTGDIGSLSAHLHGRDWSLLTPPWHLFYFSSATLASMLRRAGLEIVRAGGDGVVGVDPESPRPRLPKAIRAALLSPLATRPFRQLGLGMTVFMFARKPPA
ncbi:MAG: class I SAM-dependent methyltransferase [Vicinamibacteria bacterium]